MERELPSALLMFLGYRAAEDRIYGAITAAGFGDITRPQARLLANLDQGGTRLGVLAERTRIAKQTALALVDRLESAGYLERVPDPDDGRARLILLTTKGWDIIPVARAEEQRIDAEWTAHLGARQMHQLRAALEKLRELIDP
jgi:DNA-binding MarR family transcriptional regulator